MGSNCKFGITKFPKHRFLQEDFNLPPIRWY
ncbi:hypothetical protein ACB092_04G076900 [Castanea dentata]